VSQELKVPQVIQVLKERVGQVVQVELRELKVFWDQQVL
jgi:hypothetical protein